VQIKTRYGKAVLLDDPSISWRPSRVVDDLLGLRTDVPYQTYLLMRYGLQQQPPELVELTAGGDPDMAAEKITETWLQNVMRFAFGVDEPTAPALERAKEQWKELFSAAASRAAVGELAPELAPLLARARRLPGGTVDVPDLPSFAAWCLEERLRHGPVPLQVCENCGQPWLAERGARYCKRPANPGTMVSCRSLVAHSRYLSEHRNFHRQRRRLYDRMKRGTLPEQEYDAWKAANRPGPLGKTWVSWDDWKTGKRPRNRKTSQKKGGSDG
jgi:uncharacterized protein DUF6076